MNSFGLGLVLNFTDNATAGMQRATQTFNELNRVSDQLVANSGNLNDSFGTVSLAAQGMIIAGDSLASSGRKIVSLFTNTSQSIINTGLELAGFNNQLAALYGEDEAPLVLENIKEYAQKSVFAVKDLTTAVVTMKAVGIEAMDDITTSTGNTTQKLMDYASDLAAMFPNMRNVYGTGVNAAMGAIKEYVAEGNARTLKSSAGLDITEILGEDKGKTIEARQQQVADLIEKLGIAGYTTSLLGTPTQQLERMQDALYNTMGKLANEGGILSIYTKMLTIVADAVTRLYENEDLMNSLTTIIGGTLTSLLDPLSKVVSRLSDFVERFVEFAASHPQLTQTIIKLVALSGVALVAFGSILRFVGSYVAAVSGIATLVSKVGSVSKILTLVKSGFGSLFKTVLPLVSLAGVLYFVWNNNLLGIKDAVTKTFKEISTIISLVTDAGSDNTLSYDDWQKAKDLGILPFIEALLTLEYYWDYFKEGFKTGLEEFKTKLIETFNQLQIAGIDVNGLTESVGKFMNSLLDTGQEETWTNIGKSMGEVAGAMITIVALIPALKGLFTITSFLIKVIGYIGKIPSAIGTLFTPIKTLVTHLGDIGAFFSLLKEGGLAGLGDTLAATFGETAAKATGVGSIIGGLVLSVANFFSMWENGFSWLKEALMVLGIALAAVGLIILGVAAAPVLIGAAIVAAVATAAIVIKQHWESIKAAFIKGFNAVVGFFSTIASAIYNKVISPIVNFFKTYIFPVISKIAEIFSTVIQIIVALVRFVGNWIFQHIISPIIEKITSIWNSIISGLQKAIAAIRTFLAPIVSWISEHIITPVKEFIQGLWDKITEVASNIGDSISGAIKGVFNAASSFVCNIINTVIRGINSVVGIVNTLPGVNIKTIEELSLPKLAQGGIVEQPSTIVAGEAGAEAIVPLENNTGWIKKVASELRGSDSSNNDYSVTFEAGSVVIQVQSMSSDTDLEAAAEKLMKIIARKQQLKKMAVRN